MAIRPVTVAMDGRDSDRQPSLKLFDALMELARMYEVSGGHPRNWDLKAGYPQAEPRCQDVPRNWRRAIEALGQGLVLDVGFPESLGLTDSVTM